MFFDDYPEFVELDIRKTRNIFPVTSETLSRRCEAMLPKDLIENKTILDLGSALGAMGLWALKNGAKHYCGVEIQKSYRENSRKLLSNYFDNFELLKEIDEVKDSYDVVIAAGYIHGFLDPFEILKKICSRSKEYVVLETMVSGGLSGMNIEIQKVNMIDTNKEKTTGYSAIPNKTCLDFIMSLNGFAERKNIIPEIKEIENQYGTRRHIVLYSVGSSHFDNTLLENEIKNEHLDV